MSNVVGFLDLVTNRRVTRCCCPPGPCCLAILRVKVVVSVDYSCFTETSGVGLPTCNLTHTAVGGRELIWTAAEQELGVAESTIGECLVNAQGLKSFVVSEKFVYGGDPECRQFTTTDTDEYDVTWDLELDCEGNGTGTVTVNGSLLGTGVTLNLTFTGYVAGGEGEPATVSDSDSDVTPSAGCDSGTRTVSATVTVEAADVEG